MRLTSCIAQIPQAEACATVAAYFALNRCSPVHAMVVLCEKEWNPHNSGKKYNHKHKSSRWRSQWRHVHLLYIYIYVSPIHLEIAVMPATDVRDAGHASSCPPRMRQGFYVGKEFSDRRH